MGDDFLYLVVFLFETCSGIYIIIFIMVALIKFRNIGMVIFSL